MSLASRLVNLFTSNQIPHLALTDDHPGVTVGEDARDIIGEGISAFGSRDSKMSRTLEEEEIEDRPPYLHVCGVLRTHSELTG